MLCYLCAQLCLTLCNPLDGGALQAPLSMGFSRQEYWSGLPYTSPGDLPDPGIEPTGSGLTRYFSAQVLDCNEATFWGAII